jgi:15-cis-phytoene synthase
MSIKRIHKRKECRSLDKAAAAYQYCEGVIKNNSATFHRAFSFLPHKKKRAVWAIYAFCRRVDDIVDEGASPEEEMAAFEAEFAVFLEGRLPDQDVMLWTALRDVFGSFDMDSTPFFEMIAGQKMDLYKSRYYTVDELLHYSYHVASTVGLMLLPVLAPENAKKLKHGAVKLGQAMQITNILRDIGDDLKRDRVYLPAALMEKHGYKEEELQSGQLNAAFFGLFEELAGIAEQYYEEALETIHLYPPSSRAPVKGAAVLYRAILNKIRKNGYNSFGARNYVTKEEKARLLATI